MGLYLVGHRCASDAEVKAQVKEERSQLNVNLNLTNQGYAILLGSNV
jgi:hypothetical protein